MNIKHVLFLCLAIIASISVSAQSNKRKVVAKSATTTKRAPQKKATTTAKYRKPTTRKPVAMTKKSTSTPPKKPTTTTKTVTKTPTQSEKSNTSKTPTQSVKQQEITIANHSAEKRNEPKLYKRGKGEFNLNLGYDISLDKGGRGAFTFQPEYGWHITDNFFLGFGTGIVTDDKFKSISIPAFTRLEICFLPGSKINPFFSLQGGYDFNVSGEGETGCIRINPFTGFRVPIGKTTDFMCGFGYTRTIINGGGANYLGFKAGLSFNSAGQGAKRFFNSLDYSFDLETYTPRTMKYDDDDEEKYSNFYGLRFSITAPIVNDCLYAGISLGAGRYTLKDVEKNYEETTGEIYANVMARVKYKAKTLSIGDSLYPFAQLDFGERGATPKDHISFVAIPSVGISLKTGKKQSLDASVGYDTNAIDGNMDKKSGGLRIALGYTL